MRTGSMVFGIIGGLVALGYGLVGFASGNLIGFLGAEEIGDVVVALSIGVPIAAMLGAGMVKSVPFLGFLLMGGAVAGFVNFLGFNSFVFVPVILIGLGALLAFFGMFEKSAEPSQSRLMPSVTTKSAPAMTAYESAMQEKDCPYCGEEILAIAKKCRYCGEWLPQATVAETQESIDTEEEPDSLDRAIWLACQDISSPSSISEIAELTGKSMYDVGQAVDRLVSTGFCTEHSGNDVVLRYRFK